LERTTVTETTAGEQVRTVGPWLKWAWRRFALDFSEYSSLDAAIESAAYSANDGEEAFGCIEGPEGVVAREVVDAKWKAIDERNSARWRAQAAAAEPMTHHVRLLPPLHLDEPSEWAVISTHMSAEEAEAAAAPLRARFGDRVQVRAIRRPRSRTAPNGSATTR
jgi:hypothetical protein